MTFSKAYYIFLALFVNLFVLLSSQTLGHHKLPYSAHHVARGGDKLILKGLTFHGFHGALPEERKLGQNFFVDVDAWVDLRPAGKSDILSDAIDYTEIYSIVKEVIEGPPHNLLESVAEEIASTTLTKLPPISCVRVTIGKPDVAVQGPVDFLGVEILRNRSDVPN